MKTGVKIAIIAGATLGLGTVGYFIYKGMKKKKEEKKLAQMEDEDSLPPNYQKDPNGDVRQDLPSVVVPNTVTPTSTVVANQSSAIVEPQPRPFTGSPVNHYTPTGVAVPSAPTSLPNNVYNVGYVHLKKGELYNLTISMGAQRPAFGTLRKNDKVLITGMGAFDGVQKVLKVWKDKNGKLGAIYFHNPNVKINSKTDRTWENKATVRFIDRPNLGGSGAFGMGGFPRP